MDNNNKIGNSVSGSENMKQPIEMDNIAQRISAALTLMYNQEENDIERFLQVSETVKIIKTPQ